MVPALNQYPSIGSDTLSYDGNGNLETGRGGASYVHNSDNQLTSALVGGVPASYKYDAVGRRTEKSVNGATVRYVHAGPMEISETDAAGNILVRYVPGAGIDQRTAMMDLATGETFYYHTGRLGSVQALADGTGTITDQYLYTPFGIEEPLVTSDNPFRYTGRRFDPESGLCPTGLSAASFDPPDRMIACATACEIPRPLL